MSDASTRSPAHAAGRRIRTAASSAQRGRRASGRPAAASVTTTQTQLESPPQQADRSIVLRLRGAHRAKTRTVQWADNVVDNEGMGRKSSKVCCIYHKPKAPDESSDESSSDSSDSSSDDAADADHKGKDSRRRIPKPKTDDDGDHNRQHDHADVCQHNSDKSPGRSEGTAAMSEGGTVDGDGKRASSPNAYEKVPRSHKSLGR